jgi:hypothetical protein
MSDELSNIADERVLLLISVVSNWNTDVIVFKGTYITPVAQYEISVPVSVSIVKEHAGINIKIYFKILNI